MIVQDFARELVSGHPRYWKYIFKDFLARAWQNHIVWWVLRLVPREVKYWVVVQAATKGEQGNPSEVDAVTMLKRLSR